MSIRGTLERFVDRIGVLWGQIGLLILFLVALNFAAGVIGKQVHHFRRTHRPAVEDAYDGVPWAAQYFKSLRRTTVRWYPYVYWKSSPISSAYLNVDQQGNRATWNKHNKESNHGRPLTVFTFGGSTMWGYCVRDDYTPASLLSKRLAEKTNYNVKIFNYGQVGYVSTQEVLLLYQLLRQGLRPDVVIFYDGINDTFSAYQAGIAGLAGNESSRVREFNLVGGNRPRRRRLYLTALRTFLFNTNTAQLGRIIGGRTDAAASDHAEARDILSYLAPRRDSARPRDLEQQVLDLYLFNKRLVEMMGRQFGFQPLFFWQPAIYFKSKLTPHERYFVRDPQCEKFFLAASQRMTAIAPANGVRDLSDIFKDKTETYFTDTWHPTESGNEMIADSMMADVASALAQAARSGAVPGRTAAAASPAGEADSATRDQVTNPEVTGNRASAPPMIVTASVPIP